MYDIYTYPKEKAKSQMFFSTNLQASDIAKVFAKPIQLSYVQKLYAMNVKCSIFLLKTL